MKRTTSAKHIYNLIMVVKQVSLSVFIAIAGLSNQGNNPCRRGRIHTTNEYEYVGNEETILQTAATHSKRNLDQISTGQRAAFALSVFLAMNRSAKSAPPALLIDDPVAHIDDLNALSFLDYLIDLVINTNRQIFFATADSRIAALFSRKFSFLGESFVTIELTNSEKVKQEVNRIN